MISIASHDSLDALRNCLSSLPSACAGLRWSAVVLQNVPCDEDRTLEDSFPWVTVKRNPRPRGFGANHNTVLEPLLGEIAPRYAVVLNDDTELPPRSIATLVAHSDADPTVGVCGPLTYWPDGSVQPVYYSFPDRGRSFLAALVPRISQAVPVTSGKGWLRGSCLCLRLSALADIGLFDTRFFMYFEDTDICARLWTAGWRVAVCEDTSITHAAYSTVSRPELVGSMKRQFLRSQYLYHQKYHGHLFASLLAGWTRMGLRLRASVRLLSRSENQAARTETRQLLELSRYRPTDALPHENP